MDYNPGGLQFNIECTVTAGDLADTRREKPIKRRAALNFRRNGAPEEIRTPDPQIRSLVHIDCMGMRMLSNPL
jgi:hypothetical protein